MHQGAPRKEVSFPWRGAQCANGAKLQGGGGPAVVSLFLKNPAYNFKSPAKPNLSPNTEFLSPVFTLNLQFGETQCEIS